VTVDGARWSFPTLYLGQADSHGLRFRLVLIETRPASAAEQELIAYARRPKDTRDAYAGLPALPAGAPVVARVDLVRQ